MWHDQSDALPRSGYPSVERSDNHKDLGSEMASVMNFCPFPGRHFMEKTSGSIMKIMSAVFLG